VPAAFAAEAGLAPLQSIELPSRFGEIHMAWHGPQPTIGSLKRVAEELGGSIGDYLFVQILPKASLSFSLVKKSVVEGARGLQRLQIETGSSPAGDDETALQGVAYSLGIESNNGFVVAIRRRLQARAENDLLSLLPKETESEHSQALKELLELVGG
jgi:hypothetical protein